MEQKLYQTLATSFTAYQNCIQSNNEYWRDHWKDQINGLCDRLLPHGSGFDSGSTFDFDRSRENRLVLYTSFHHMDENGYYCGWSDHDVIVTPNLLQHGFDLRVTGRNVRDIKDYIFECFDIALAETI